MVTIEYPPIAKNRGPGFWMRPGNLWAARRMFRADHSIDWRDSFDEASGADSSRSVPFSTLHNRAAGTPFKFIILGDTGEGDRSQYGLLPLIRGLNPDFMIINGDLAYPAGSMEDFRAGFFEVYRDLDIPIWAVPGNHEYYSEHGGREFYEMFCTDAQRALWDRYGLRFRRQPGTYWELNDDVPDRPLVVLGVDTLKAASLDETPRGARGDFRQHEWLHRRLTDADAKGKNVILLFHIPGLTGGEHAKDTKLALLHQTIAGHPCVRLVVCGHVHNYQDYAPGDFTRYLNRVHSARIAPGFSAHYRVSGGGGAYLADTSYDNPQYAIAELYPKPARWAEHVGVVRRLVDWVGLDRTPVGRALASVDESTLRDNDAAKYHSMLLVEVDEHGRANVYPVYLDDVVNLFSHLPDGTVVNVQRPNPPAHPDAVDQCIQRAQGVRV
jgi:3',5'-cyclic AMP phosphodiesterase CpdA